MRRPCTRLRFAALLPIKPLILNGLLALREPFTEIDDPDTGPDSDQDGALSPLWYTGWAAAAVAGGVVGYTLGGGADGGNASLAHGLNGVLIMGIAALLHEKRVRRARYGERFRTSHDPLTGLYNRSHMFEHIPRLLAAHDRADSRGIGLALFRLNSIGEINRDHGHELGDTLLIKVAEAIRAEIRASDTAVRSAGDEFSLFLSTDSLETATLVSDRIAARIRNLRLSPLPPEDIAVEVGIGFHAPGASLETFFAEVETGMAPRTA